MLTGRNSKEIAIELGISPHTVDDRLRSAIRTLGVATRFQAARVLADVEHGAPQPLMHQAEDIATGPLDPAETLPVEGGDAQDDTVSRLAVREDQARYVPASPPDEGRIALPFAWGGEKPRNDLTPLARIAWMILLLVLIVAALGFFVIAAEGLARIYWVAR